MPQASVMVMDDKGLITNVMTKEQGEQLLEQGEAIYEQLVELNHNLGKLAAILLENLNGQEEG